MAVAGNGDTRGYLQRSPRQLLSRRHRRWQRLHQKLSPEKCQAIAPPAPPSQATATLEAISRAVASMTPMTLWQTESSPANPGAPKMYFARRQHEQKGTTMRLTLPIIVCRRRGQSDKLSIEQQTSSLHGPRGHRGPTIGSLLTCLPGRRQSLEEAHAA